jgi:chemotaxis protein methyltransferase CheR
MTDAECVAFLQWALPRLGLRWQGFRKVRRQVCRRVSRRIAELELSDAEAYRAVLEGHEREWDVLAHLCRATISRFWRDRAVFETLRDEVLPALGPTVSAWSAGCASGEEPYSLVLAAAEAGVAIRVLATDVDPALLERAERACYPESSLRDLPPDVRERAFDRGCLRAEYREPVQLRRHDLRDAPPGGPFDLVLCRNLVFTYFADDLQLEVGRRLGRSLRPGGALVVGAHEALPNGLDDFEPCPARHGVYRRRQASYADAEDRRI